MGFPSRDNVDIVELNTEIERQLGEVVNDAKIIQNSESRGCFMLNRTDK